MKKFSTIIQWLLLIGIAVLCFRGCDYHHLQVPRLTVSPWMVIPYGLSLAYLWTDVWKIGVVKPFTCLQCLTGWFSLIIAAMGRVDNWYLYAPLGVFVASLYTSLKLRWL